MDIAFIGFTLDTIGKLMVAFTAIMVHYRFWKEHRIDEAVFRTMKREQILALLELPRLLLVICSKFQKNYEWQIRKFPNHFDNFWGNWRFDGKEIVASHFPFGSRRFLA